MNPLFHTEFSISDSLKNVRKSVLIYETIIESPSMYVLTGKEKKCGASLIADAELMQRIQEQIGEDYYVLPSSVHETLILPQSKAPDPTELKEMVMAVNRSEVEPEDFLSDNVYKYKASRKAIELAVPDKSRERRR